MAQKLSEKSLMIGYGLSSTKYVCPICGHRTYKRYIFFGTNEPIQADMVGWCYRGQYHDGQLLSPKQWRTAHKSDGRFIQPQGCQIRPKNKPAATQPSYIPNEYVAPTLRQENSFTKYLCRLFDRHKVTDVMTAYLVGTYHYSPIWWQTDVNDNVRAGKWIIYDKHGNRLKNFVGWVENDLIKEGKLNAPYNRVQCMFGEHLIKQHPHKPICVVEAEKTAIVCAIARPQYLWLSVGSKSNFNANTMRALFRRHCYAYPDGDAIEEWQAKAIDLRTQGYQIEVVDCYPSYISDAQKADGYDLADLILSQREIDRTLYYLSDLIKRNHAIGSLIEKLNLMIDDVSRL